MTRRRKRQDEERYEEGEDEDYQEEGEEEDDNLDGESLHAEDVAAGTE